MTEHKRGVKAIIGFDHALIEPYIILVNRFRKFKVTLDMICRDGNNGKKRPWIDIARKNNDRA